MGEAIQNFVFDADEPHALRVVMRGDAPWFVAKDVCSILQVKDASDAVEPLDDDEKGRVSIPTLGGQQEMLIVSEGGLYTLILRSRLATTPGSMAHRFRKWVTGELLPQVRKTGAYAPDPLAGWDWEMIGVKIQLVREARLAHGRQAAAALWKDLGLPMAEMAPTGIRPSGMQGVDIVQQFLAECTETDPHGHVQARALSTRFNEWAEANHAPSMTERTLAMCLEALGIAKSRGRLHSYLGLRLRLM